MAGASHAFPGSRWWKFDFHTHTPASTDWQGDPEITPEAWLLTFMAAEVDCVAVTDHNSGAWVDKLKAAYAAMKGRADDGVPDPGFRELTLFPGVEISANPGVHILALFDPSNASEDVTTLLGRVKYEGIKGDSNAVTRTSLAEVLAAILDVGALPIPAHAGDAKGLLERREGDKSRVDSLTLQQVVEEDGLLAIEWCGEEFAAPAAVAKAAQRLSRVLGSDWHGEEHHNVPGSRFSWVKMGTPTLEGLRLALIDGARFSLKRSVDGPFDPAHLPRHRLTALAVTSARFMGNGRPAVAAFSPYLNAIVGGRGTGKSTLVHALRLAAGRGGELRTPSAPQKAFAEFTQKAKPQSSGGGVRAETKFRLEWADDDALHAAEWTNLDEPRLVFYDWSDAGWSPSKHQTASEARLPIRILSQGQISDLADTGRTYLLGIIDAAAHVEPLRQSLESARLAFFSQCTKLRELDARLALLPEAERQRDEAAQKVAALSTAGHAEVTTAYAVARAEQRAVARTMDQVAATAERLSAAAAEIVLDDWPETVGAGPDDGIRDWRAAFESELIDVRERVGGEADRLRDMVSRMRADPRLVEWEQRCARAKTAYEALSSELAAAGVQNPGALNEWTLQLQMAEERVAELTRVKADRDVLSQQIQEQKALVAERRRAITVARQAFLAQALTGNPHVKLTVAAFGFDAGHYAAELKGLLEIDDERFAGGILGGDVGRPGMAAEIEDAADKGEAVARVRERILARGEGLHGKFVKYLDKKPPEFADRVAVWWPEDDLRVEYRRDGKWTPISQASQGQRAAALLAFLLAFGDEPLVLDQPEDDLDNHLIYELIVRQLRENKLRRQLIVVTHNPNVVVNGDAELVHVMGFAGGQCYVQQSGGLQDAAVRSEVCRVMEGGHEAFARRWKRLGERQ